jgi:hypothetical protein
LTDTFKSTPEEQHSIAAQHTVSDEAAQLRLAASSGRGPSPNVIIQDVEEGAKGSKKRRK